MYKNTNLLHCTNVSESIESEKEMKDNTHDVAVTNFAVQGEGSLESILPTEKVCKDFEGMCAWAYQKVMYFWMNGKCLVNEVVIFVTSH